MKDSTLLILLAGGAALAAYFILQSRKTTASASLAQQQLQLQAQAAKPENQLIAGGIKAGTDIITSVIRGLTNRSADTSSSSSSGSGFSLGDMQGFGGIN